MELNVKIFTLFILLLGFTFRSAEAYQGADLQKVRSINGDSTGLLSVYLDCGPCDQVFVRRKISFVNYVRDRSLADLHVFVTDERTGSGGRNFTLSFIGQKQFEGQNISLTYTSHEGDSFDDVRRELADAIKRGMFPFALHTSVGEQLSVSYKERGGSDTQPQEDPWNNWVFEVYAGGYVEEEESKGRLDVRYGLYARRVTEEWKILVRPYFNHNVRRFESSEERIRNVSKRHGFEGELIKSLTNHWSVGLFNDVLSSTFSNMDLRVELAPAVEYSLFPYSMSSRKEITFRYQIHGGYYNYIEETLFGKRDELLYRHTLSASVEFEQPWGSIDTNLEGSHYLHDFDKNRLEFESRIRLRVAKGLQIDVSGGVEIIHDQLFLAKGDASLDEVLLQQSQLATTFEVTGRIGFSYTFGSIYNNVVNTRL